MIVLLNCSINLLADNTNPSMGELTVSNDSVLIAYDDLKLANTKMIELEYQKKINDNLRTVISNDSIIIRKYADVNNTLNNTNKKLLTQRNICLGVAIIGIITSIIFIVK